MPAVVGNMAHIQAQFLSWAVEIRDWLSRISCTTPVQVIGGGIYRAKRTDLT